jgi:hypothetical protein
MMKLPQPLSIHVTRFYEQHSALNLSDISENLLVSIIQNKKTELNNFFMVGMGTCSLLLRLGAVVQLSKKLEEGSEEEDVLLMKQVIENLRENLPSDSNWKNIWKIASENNKKWADFVIAEKGKVSIIDSFITFRNKFVHGIIKIDLSQSKEIYNGIILLSDMIAKSSKLFENTSIIEEKDKYFFVENNSKICLDPFVKKGESNGLPYIFQGLYNNKKTAELINTFYGDIEKKDDSSDFDSVFQPMINVLNSGYNQVFDHSNRISYYSKCFVGREKECQSIIDWVTSIEKCNILPIYSDAGMGKGALVANLISEFQDESIPVLVHFCGSGLQNNLQAVIVHLILQAKKQQLWKIEDQEIEDKLSRIPTKFHEQITLLHHLLDHCFVPSRKNTHKKLVIIVDGLDEASIAYPSLNISDWFNNYDNNGEVVDSWKSSDNIKWVFTYRKGFYNFPKFNSSYSLELLQPLKGLNTKSVEEALNRFSPSKDFITEVIQRGQVL